MTIQWHLIPPGSSQAVNNTLRKILTPENYHKKEWTLTEIIQTQDWRKFQALKILDGRNAAGEKYPGLELLDPATGLPFCYKFKVLSRQACCETKDGYKIHPSVQSYESRESDNEILPSYDELPVPGDVVEWKASFRYFDDNKGRPTTAASLREWDVRGERHHTYVRFIVDADGCIRVPYPYSHSMLEKYGAEVVARKFRKIDKTDKRKVSNHFFKEVPPEYKAPKAEKK